MKILIIGCSCIGKSTVAKMVSSDLGIRAVSIDEEYGGADCLSMPKGRSRSLMCPAGCLAGSSGALGGSPGPKA